MSEQDGARLFPIQDDYRYTHAPYPRRIPWAVAERAFSVYANRYGRDQSLERLAERGGFGPGEMDEFLPGWKDELSVFTRLTRERDAARSTGQALLDVLAERSAEVTELRAILAPLLNKPLDQRAIDRRCRFCAERTPGEWAYQENHTPDCPVLRRDALLGRGATGG